MDKGKKKKEDLERLEAEKEFLARFESERKVKRGTESEQSSQMDTESESEVSKKRNRKSPTDTEKRSVKSRKVETDEEEPFQEDEVLELGNDPLENLGKTVGKIRKWLGLPPNARMIKKVYASKLEEYIEELQVQITRAREERVVLETRVEERGKKMEEMLRNVVKEELKGSGEKNVPARQATFAEALGRKDIPKVTGMKGAVLPVPNLVVVRQENKDGEEVKRKLKELVKPSEIGLKVKRLSKIRNGVMIEAESEEGVLKLIENKALKKAGMSVGKPSKRNPVVMVYDVSSALSDEELKNEIFKRNMADSEIEGKDFNKEFMVKHKYKERGDRGTEGKRNHVVAECSVRVRNWLRRKDRLYIEWESCRIKDYVDVARCFKCQRFGHVAKFCTNAKPSCSYCAGEHDFKDCKRKGKEEAKCVNCDREKRTEVRHPASWRKCPVYEKAARRHSEQTDYGV